MSSEQSAFIVYKSKYFNVVEGVRQGGVLSGLLYLVFIYDKLHGSEENNKIGIFNIAFYALYTSFCNLYSNAFCHAHSIKIC
jgi:hypothetical protein